MQNVDALDPDPQIFANQQVWIQVAKCQQKHFLSRLIKKRLRFYRYLKILDFLDIHEFTSFKVVFSTSLLLLHLAKSRLVEQQNLD